MLQGSALDVFPTRGPGLLTIHEWPVRPFLARLLYSLMRATNKQSDQACGSPAWLVPASLLSPFSLGAEEIIGKEKESRRDMWAGWARWQQSSTCLAREGIDNKSKKYQQTQTARLDSPCPLPYSPAPLSCLLHSCSIPSSRLNPPLSRRHNAQPRDWIVQQRVVSSPSAWTPTPNFPIKSRHNLPCHLQLRIYATSSPPYTKYFLFTFARGHSLSDRKCPTTTAYTRRDQGCPPFPPSRGMCRHGPATGWVPIPV